MQEPILILIHGLAGHGKDTVAAMFAEKLIKKNYTAIRISQADSLKEGASAMLNIPLKECEEQPFTLPIKDFTREQKAAPINSLGMTLGKYLQKLGDGLRQVYDEDYWMDLRFEKIESLQGISGKVAFITPDIRYPNELNSRGYNSLTLKVFRPDFDLNDGRDKSHISEKGLPDSEFDWTILNNGTLEQLDQMVQEIVDGIF